VGIEELERRKREIIDNHTEAMIQINDKLVQNIDTGLRDNIRGINFDLNAFDKVKALFNLSTDKGLKMNSEHRMELAKLYFELQKSNISIIMNDRTEGYESLLKSINDDIDIAKKRLAQIEVELRSADSDGRDSLEEERKGQMKSFPEL
jgi:hypothetical protein